jgi:hypothetical protein
MKKTMIALTLVLALALVWTQSVSAQTQPAAVQDTLKQYVADLQKKPDDQALREKIIKLALEMKPAPAIPEEAKRFMARGVAAVKDAKSADDFKDAVAEFEKAALAAP